MEDRTFDLGLSAKKRDKLGKFRERLRDVLQPYHNDSWLVRFLKARNFDLKKSESMFRKGLHQDVAWREEMKVDELFHHLKEPEAWQKYGFGGALGYATDGCPVFLSPAGNMDLKGLLHAVSVSELTKVFIKILETLQRDVISQAEKLGREISGIYLIIDVENLSHHHLWKPGMQFFTSVVVLCEQHYPELLHRVMIVRAPRVFPVVYSMVKPFMSADTRRKTTIFSITSDFTCDLLKFADAAILPQYWGGSLIEDGNPMCPQTVRLGGKVSKDLYLTGCDLSVSTTQMATADVARGGTLQLEYVTTQCNSVLRYEFRTEAHDIGFGVWRREDAGGKVPIVKTERVNCHLVPETGEVTLEESGTYVVRFDNSYSWAKGKRLSYWVELLQQDPANDATERELEGADGEEEEEDDDDDKFMPAS